MDDLITIAENMKPVEIPRLKDSLEAEGIESIIKDEFAIYGRDIAGGVKLQVREKDVKRAMEIFKEIGYLQQDMGEEEMSFLKTLASPTEYVPVIRHWPLEKRLMLIAVVASIIIALLAYLLFNRTGPHQ